MRHALTLFVTAYLAAWFAAETSAAPPRRVARTVVEIRGDQFVINGAATYAGREWQGHKIEGLLFNSRMVQGIFDDVNPSTAKRWSYPDTGQWDAERNTREFVAAMPEWRKHGLLAFTLCLQGGSPYGYFGGKHPWINTAFAADGSLDSNYMARAEKILDRADELGMVVILSLYYFGQDERLSDETAVKRGVNEAIDWLFERGYRNVLIEIDNECDVARYDHAILQADRVHELIEQVKARERDGRRFLTGTSFKGGAVPTVKVVAVSDFLLLHGNGQSPQGIKRQIRNTREVKSYRPMPIVCNEDDHFDFDKPENNLQSAVEGYASWGYFDYRHGDDPWEAGFQSVPVDWRISTPRKRAFFQRIAEITGAKP